MKNKLMELSKISFIRNVIIMATGTAAAQAITMIFSPFITRLYGPEAFGLLGVFTTIVGVIAPIAALTYPIAIVLPKSETEAKGIARLSLYITLFVTIIISLVLLFFNQQIVKVFQIEEISAFLYLIPVVVLFSGLSEIIEQWFIRTKKFIITSKVTFLQSLILNGTKVGFGLVYPLASVLILLTVSGYALKALLMILWKDNNKYKVSDKSIKKSIPMKEVAKKYLEFPKYRAPEVFINTASQGLPILLLTSFFGPASAGFYSITKTVLSMPSTLIGKSVGDVFYPRINEAANNSEKITPLIIKATISLALVGILPYGILFFMGPWIFSLVFGSEWITAGEYAKWISLWSFFGFINIPSVRSLPVISAQQFQLKFTILMLTIRISVLAIGFYIFENDVIAIALFGTFGAILNFLLILITIFKSKRFDQLEKSKT